MTISWLHYTSKAVKLTFITILCYHALAEIHAALVASRILSHSDVLKFDSTVLRRDESASTSCEQWYELPSCSSLLTFNSTLPYCTVIAKASRKALR